MNSKSRKILGIDPGTNLLGWGMVLERGQKITALKYGCVQTESRLDLPHRLLIISSELRAIMSNEAPDEVAIEELFFFKNQKTVMSVAQARGAAIVAAMEQGLPVFEYTPLQVKQALTGYGRAEKKQIQEMVKIVCHLEAIPKPDDAADALAIAICHAQTSQRLVHK